MLLFLTFIALFLLILKRMLKKRQESNDNDEGNEQRGRWTHGAERN